MKNLAIILVSILALQSCNKGNQEINQNKAPHTGYKHDFKNEKFSFNAQKETVIVTKRGNKILCKPNSFVDKKGNIIKGDVQIHFTEYLNPIDFFLSKINMQYDSNGTLYTFRSAGMFNITGMKDTEEIFINSKNKPSIYFKKVVKDELNYSFYSHDSTKRTWKNENDLLIKPTISKSNKLLKLFKPQKQDSSMIPINFLVDYSQLPDLTPYKNLKFVFHPSNAKRYFRLGTIIWENIRIKKSDSPNKFIILLKKGNRLDSMIAFPKFSEQDYQVAFAKYNSKKAKMEREQMAAIRSEFMNLSINKFGTWNCDRPEFLNSSIYSLKFVTNENQNVLFDNFQVAFDNFNGVFTMNQKDFRIIKDKSLMIWQTKNDSLYYGYVEHSIINSIDKVSLTVKLKGGTFKQ